MLKQYLNYFSFSFNKEIFYDIQLLPKHLNRKFYTFKLTTSPRQTDSLMSLVWRCKIFNFKSLRISWLSKNSMGIKLGEQIV